MTFDSFQESTWNDQTWCENINCSFLIHLRKEIDHLVSLPQWSIRSVSVTAKAYYRGYYIAAFLYSRADRKGPLLIGRDLKCVAFAPMATATTRACGSRLAHFAAQPRQPRHRGSSKWSHVENSESRRAIERGRRYGATSSRPRLSLCLSHLLSSPRLWIESNRYKIFTNYIGELFVRYATCARKRFLI